MFKHTSFSTPQPLRLWEHNQINPSLHHHSITQGATEQVNTYKTALEFKNKPVKAYAKVFAGSECGYCG